MPKKVYLKPLDLVKKSKHHTAYTGDGAIGTEGNPPKIYKMEFWGGIARDVDESTYQRFKDVGICDTAKPSLGDED